MPDLVLHNAVLPGLPGPRTVSIEDGRIQRITAEHAGGDRPREADRTSGPLRTIDVGGRAVLPSFVEPHLHLDKALLDARLPNLEGTLAGAIKVTGALKAEFTVDDCIDRARTVLDLAIANGTGTIRSHPDVDPIAHLVGVDAMLALREEYRDRIDLQIVAFPQEGIIKAPESLALMEEALRKGADVVGGCTYNEPSLEECHEHIDEVFDLAEKYDVPVDMHCDFAVDDSDPRYALVEHIADVAIARGMQGRVTLGHMTSLASLSGQHRIQVWDKIRQAGINIVVLPFTDMHLNGRDDDHNVRRGVAPVTLMWDVGVSVGLSSNNVRNAFTPFGNADILDVALFLAQVGHMGSPSHFQRLLDTVTHRNAEIIGIDEGYGVQVGDRADLVVLDNPDPVDALLSRSVRSFVIKGGRVVAETTKSTTLHQDHP
ncbi:amidohydrolase family protein [Microlunatus elymi]|uniref:Amidohydrolase family protein n=1 Tax=Microlunatus elymi TaxID=2596828 RepID=A0A516Q2U5_9ACTN|nr:amidohydrolase family protein [Microlunatus elymi]QDP97753.1 amidohydrolase family protein [Microlunatus elymi]